MRSKQAVWASKARPIPSLPRMALSSRPKLNLKRGKATVPFVGTKLAIHRSQRSGVMAARKSGRLESRVAGEVHLSLSASIELSEQVIVTERFADHGSEPAHILGRVSEQFNLTALTEFARNVRQRIPD